MFENETKNITDTKSKKKNNLDSNMKRNYFTNMKNIFKPYGAFDRGNFFHVQQSCFLGMKKICLIDH